MLRQSAASTIFAILAGCSASQTEAEDHAGCPIHESRDWAASLTPADSRNSAFVLVVTGVIDLPNPTYELEWTPGPMDRRRPPGLVLNVDATPTGEIAIQVIDVRAVSYEFETEIPAFREVRIVCGDRSLAVIPEVSG